jgi:hypothetical protein
MHKDQAMRSMHLAQNGVQPPPGFAPHTPNMSMDALSPATLGQGIGVGQSPRTTTTGRAMTRDVSKSGGAMLPPQSPATGVATGVRASTPKPIMLKTPKVKEEHLVSWSAITPKRGTDPSSRILHPNLSSHPPTWSTFPSRLNNPIIPYRS